MATYATAADFEAYVEGWDTTDAAALERLLGRAERDIDGLLGYHPIIAATGRKIDPATLEDWEAEALARAVCAQAEHRHLVTEPALAGATPTPGLKRVKGPDFEKEYAVSVAAPKAAPYYGRKVRHELLPISHLRHLNARAVG